MSTHYEFGLACDLKPDVPQSVLDTLASMIGCPGVALAAPPDHDFFRHCDWRHLLHPGHGTFPGAVGGALRRAYRYNLPALQGGAPVFRYTLSCHVGLIDDQVANDFFFFLHWLAPHSETVGCVGYYRPYDLAAVETPRLLYFRDGRVAVLAVTGAPVEIAFEAS